MRVVRDQFRGVRLLPRLSLGVALGVGVAGALVDVSSSVRLPDGVDRRWGRDDAFYGVDPGTFSFVLDNADGQFTPENPSSPLATTLSEGMAACISVGGRLTGGTVRTVEPEFPGGDAAWASVRVTCDDALGVLARTELAGIAEQLVLGASALGLWKFSEPEGSGVAVDSGPFGLAPFGVPVFGYAPSTGAPTFGTSPLPWSAETQATFTTAAASSPQYLFGTEFDVPDFGYEASSGGWYGFWYTPGAYVADSTRHFQLTISLNNGRDVLLQKGPTTSGSTGDRFIIEVDGPSGFNGRSGRLAKGVPVYVAVRVFISGSTQYAGLYIDGVFQDLAEANYLGTSSADLTPNSIIIDFSGPNADTYTISEVSHTMRQVQGEYARDTNTLNEAVVALTSLTPGIAFDTLPTFTDAPIELDDIEGDSALDLLNTILETEQGYAHVETTGTLTSPTSKVVLRSRDRPSTPTASFNVEDDLSGAPAFIRDITNLVSSVRVDGPNGQLAVTDPTLTARAGNASEKATLPLTRDIDKRAWGQDRLQRGANTKMQIASVVVDAMTTPTDRSADLLALVPGDRVEFTELPSTVLGFDTWEGWFLGASETHTIDEHSFQLHFAPVLPHTAIYDTDRYMASGELQLNGDIDAAVTSISVESTGALLSTTETPYIIQFDDEQMTVTAVSGASSPQTVTVTRGVNGTTAAAHLDNAVLVSVPDSLYAF